MQETQRTLLKVVDDKGAKYDDKFSHLLQEFSEKLQPVQQSIMDLQTSQKDLRRDMQDSQKDLRRVMQDSQKDLWRDMRDSQKGLQNELQQIKWGGVFVMAVLSLFGTLFGNVSEKLPQIGLALMAAVLIPVVMVMAFAVLIVLWQNTFGSPSHRTASLDTTSVAP